MKLYHVQIKGMTCTHCEEVVRKAIETHGGRVLRISWQEGWALVETGNPEKILSAIEEVGYQVTGIEQDTFVAPRLPNASKNVETQTLLILGSGSAAFAAAIEARKLGAQVQMITGDRFGGTCVNVGCVPSKFLLHRAKILHTLHHPGNPFQGCSESPPMPALQQARQALIHKLLREKYEDVADAWGIERIPGKARFVDEHTVEVEGQRISFERAVIATGAHPWVPPIQGLREAGFWTSTDALESLFIPSRLAVIGANAVGLEMAQIYARLGSQVTLLEAQSHIAPFEEPELAQQLTQLLEEEGIHVITGVRIQCVETGSFGKRILCQNGLDPVEVDEILVATGRRPHTEDLNLPAAGIEADHRGAVKVDSFLRTSQPHIFAAGDVTPFPQFVYLASRMGQIAARNALGVAEETFDPRLAPRVIFTDPELASVGWTEKQAREQGYQIQTTVMDIRISARAQVEDRKGQVKLVLDPSERLLGVHLLMPQACEAIFAAHLALKAGMRAQDLVESFAPYLTYAETLRLAAQTLQTDVHKLSCCA